MRELIIQEMLWLKARRGQVYVCMFAVAAVALVLRVSGIDGDIYNTVRYLHFWWQYEPVVEFGDPIMLKDSRSQV